LKCGSFILDEQFQIYLEYTHFVMCLISLLEITFASPYSQQFQMAVPWLKRLDSGFPSQRPRFAARQDVGFVVHKAALGQVLSEYFGFPCQSFHQFLHHHNHLGLVQ
jgi:hypothetical protein